MPSFWVTLYCSALISFSTPDPRVLHRCLAASCGRRLRRVGPCFFQKLSGPDCSGKVYTAADFLVVILVTISSLVKFRHRDDFGCDGFVKPTGCFKFSWMPRPDVFDDHHDKKSPVDTVSLCRQIVRGIGRVHMSRQNVEQFIIGDLLRIIKNAYRFSMPGSRGPLLLVAGILVCPPT